ncbi:MAG: ABC transporter permease [Gammaproteobacteria bacterium]|nr:ABC transporter permease [Gammaproteobacteria bacterium]
MIELKNVHKTYRMGDSTVYALRGVSLSIAPGEFVAIMGPSGSGKSTLMHVLGLLDVPDSGSYRLYGKEAAHLDEDELAVLRREAIGFIFQQFNLLPRMSALENVSLPLLYSGRRLELDKAKLLLERVGLGTRILHKPNELSGGQQQRVAIARSLINNPRMILADEPTGNLDSASQKEILQTLKDLNAQGISIVIVTHEEEIGKQAKRLIRIRDGVIQSDEILAQQKSASIILPAAIQPTSSDRFRLSEIREHLQQGFKTLGANKIRTALSMLGILIGVSAVVAMLALGQGAQKAIEMQLASLGSNLLVLRPGATHLGGVAQEAGTTTRLTVDDAVALKEQISAVKDAAPAVSGRGQVTYGNKNWSTQILGASPAYARIHATVPEIGRFLNEEENRQRSRVAIVGTTLVRELFGGQNPIGEMIKINKVSFQIIGVLPEKGATSWRDQDDIIVIPVLTAMHRLMGKDYVDYIDIEVNDASEIDATQEATRRLMYNRHKIALSQQQEAFQIRNMADIQSALSESSRTMSVLLASIAAISLLVGGIGIMNIMLVSVTERTREIGLRKAIGARRRDILSQFLIEAVVISAVGGLLGIALGWLITQLMSSFAGWVTSISLTSVLLAVIFSGSVGIIFGLYPARKASLLNPIDALRYE